MREEQISRDDIKIVGYDNLKQSEMFGITLTSVSQDIFLLAEAACKQLLRQIEEPNYSKTTILKPKLII